VGEVADCRDDLSPAMSEQGECLAEPLRGACANQTIGRDIYSHVAEKSVGHVCMGAVTTIANGTRMDLTEKDIHARDR